MMKRINLRISDELYDRVNAYCAMQRIDNMSEFFRQAAVTKITPDVGDETLVFESLKSVHKKMHSLERQQEIFFNFFCTYFKLFLALHGELPSDQKAPATRSAMDRFEKIYTEFKNGLRQDPSMFESLLADYFEDRND